MGSACRSDWNGFGAIGDACAKLAGSPPRSLAKGFGAKGLDAVVDDEIGYAETADAASSLANTPLSTPLGLVRTTSSNRRIVIVT